mgnify:CR=1 FL=1|tara:strand:- start:34 stop:312 length:279 start_codon:yes stop_codon:yes gene_type:complete
MELLEKYKNCHLSQVKHNTLGQLTLIHKTPQNKKFLLGKKFISQTKAIIAIDLFILENISNSLLAREEKKAHNALGEAMGVIDVDSVRVLEE